MIDLTQKILSLDLEITLELNNANVLSIEAKREADQRTKERMKEAQQLFEKQKSTEVKQLEKSLREDRKKEIDNLQKKMEAFDKWIEIDALVDQLVLIAKDRICH